MPSTQQQHGGSRGDKRTKHISSSPKKKEDTCHAELPAAAAARPAHFAVAIGVEAEEAKHPGRYLAFVRETEN